MQFKSSFITLNYRFLIKLWITLIGPEALSSEDKLTLHHPSEEAKLTSVSVNWSCARFLFFTTLFLQPKYWYKPSATSFQSCSLWSGLLNPKLTVNSLSAVPIIICVLATVKSLPLLSFVLHFWMEMFYFFVLFYLKQSLTLFCSEIMTFSLLNYPQSIE